MKKIYLLVGSLLCFSLIAVGQEINMQEIAPLEQIYGDVQESENLLPMNDLGIEFGYVLYEAEIVTESDDVVLEVENVRDYAAIYIDNNLQGTMTDNRKKVTLNVSLGTHKLRLYVENIGRITYGPEILDNSKGLFGSISLDGEEIEGWKIIPLNVKDCDINSLSFTKEVTSDIPCFHKGYFDIGTPESTYLDISGWGMGEVWINGQYMGSYWEEEKQQSIQIPAENLVMGNNEIVVFELKNNQQKSMRLSDKPLFK